MRNVSPEQSDRAMADGGGRAEGRSGKNEDERWLTQAEPVWGSGSESQTVTLRLPRSLKILAAQEATKEKQKKIEITRERMRIRM